MNKALIVSLVLLSAATSAVAQKNQASAARAGQTAQAQETASDPAQFRKDFVKASEEYRDSLKALAALEEKSLKRLEEKHAQLKQLHSEGLIARRELEENETALADARAKFENAGKQLASAETVLEAALKAPAQPAASAAALEVASAGTVVRSWTTGHKGLDQLINYYGNQYGVDPYLVYCVMHQESRFSATATSHAGAQGLMQLMPGTAARYGVTNPYDPAQNVRAGTRYLRDLLRLFNGNVQLALAGYNAGEGAVMKYGNKVPPYRETQNYVRTIGTRYGSGLHPTIKSYAPKGGKAK
ncbi:MAG TPA: transglycosylase SLT domain-containing protein [Pyrinomonadaceae bacterium]|nr:transglycosylase SLT domain-containing protein [Pyrinomonadaceae bacterium]